MWPSRIRSSLERCCKRQALLPRPVVCQQRRYAAAVDASEESSDTSWFGSHVDGIECTEEALRFAELRGRARSHSSQQPAVPVLLVIDGGPIIRRAFATSTWRTKCPNTGKRVAAFRCFTRDVLRICRSLPGVDAVVFVPDGRCTERVQRHHHFRARSALPPWIPYKRGSVLGKDEWNAYRFLLSHQQSWMLELLGVLGIPVVGGGNRDPGDVIAALSEKAGSEGWLTRIATQDTRYHALLDGDSVRALDSRTMDLVSDTDVLLEHGVRPKHIPDLFALAGDHYNNLKGVFTFGEFRAAAALRKFDGVDDLLRNRHRVSSKLRRWRLEKFEEGIRRNRWLLELRAENCAGDAALASPLELYRPPRNVSIENVFQFTQSNDIPWSHAFPGMLLSVLDARQARQQADGRRAGACE